MFDFIYKLTVILTFVVISFYTFETRKIRKITAQQRDLQLLPTVVLYIRKRSGSRRLYVRNISLNPALNVHFEVSKLKINNDAFEFSFRMLDSNKQLTSQEERGIGINLKINGIVNDKPLENFLAYFDPDNMNEESRVCVSISFSDSTGQKYLTKVGFKKTGIEIFKAPKRIS